MAEKAARQNLFTSAKKVESTKENKSKVNAIPVPPDLMPFIKDFTEAKEEFKNWESKKKIAEGAIKEKAKELYLAEYKRHRRHIGSFKLDTVTVSVQDRYATLSDDVAIIISANFPDAVVTTTEYMFNQEILKKYIDEISEALQSAKGIPPEELASLILAKEVTSVKPGTIETLANYGDKKMDDLFHAISPVISLR